MFKRFSHYFACLLLVLIPLQALAAANMLVCNGMMQAEASKQIAAEMPCHQHVTKHAANHTKQAESHKSACKTNCATVCANLCALIAATNNIKLSFALNESQIVDFNQLIYVSITQTNLQRPPIFLS
jgi:hypothetical protein